MNEEQKTILIASILTGIVLGGCRVKVGDKFLPEANVREIER